MGKRGELIRVACHTRPPPWRTCRFPDRSTAAEQESPCHGPSNETAHRRRSVKSGDEDSGTADEHEANAEHVAHGEQQGDKQHKHDHQHGTDVARSNEPSRAEPEKGWRHVAGAQRGDHAWPARPPGAEREAARIRVQPDAAQPPTRQQGNCSMAAFMGDGDGMPAYPPSEPRPDNHESDSEARERNPLGRGQLPGQRV